MRKNETCRAARYSLRSIPLSAAATLPRPADSFLCRQPSSNRQRRLVPRECCAQKPKSRKFGPFPAAMPPSTTPQGMHFSYPHDIIASHSVHSINRFGKGEEDRYGEKKRDANLVDLRVREETPKSDECQIYIVNFNRHFLMYILYRRVRSRTHLFFIFSRLSKYEVWQIYAKKLKNRALQSKCNYSTLSTYH